MLTTRLSCGRKQELKRIENEAVETDLLAYKHSTQRTRVDLIQI